MLITYRAKKTPPKLKTLLNDGEHTYAWLWGFSNIIPEDAREDITENFMYRRICCADPEEFHNYFRRNVKKYQGRFVKLLQAEGYEIDPMITNFVNELTLNGSEGTTATTQTANETTTGSGETNGTATTQHGHTITTESANTRTPELTSTTTHNTKTETERTNTGTQTTNGEETGTSTTSTTRNETEETTHGKTLEHSYDSTESGTDSKLGTETTEDAAGKTTETTTDEGTKKETTQRDMGNSTGTGDARFGEIIQEEGSERNTHGASADYARTSQETQNGARVTARSSGGINTDMPETDTGTIINAMNNAAAGNVESAALTYASTGTFATEANRESFDGYRTDTSETQTGSTYDETSYNGRRTLKAQHETTETTRSQTVDSVERVETSGADTTTVTHNTTDTTNRTHTGADTDREGGKTITTTKGTTQENGETGNTTTSTRTDNLTESTATENTGTDKVQETGTEITEGTQTQTNSGEDTQINRSTTENNTERKQEGSEERRAKEERTAFHVISGRNGYSPQELLMRFQDFVLNSRALEWIEEQLEICFFQVEVDEDDE